MKKSKFLVIAILVIIAFFNSCQTENKVLLRKIISERQKILVCPVHILDNQNSSYDTTCSKTIVNYINSKNYGFAEFTTLVPPANNEWRHNEAKMLTISINKFVEFVKKSNLPENTYILYPEFLKIGPNSTIVGVHYCLLNYEGEIVMRGLINSHWPEYQKVNPKNNNDCVNVFINGFENKITKK